MGSSIGKSVFVIATATHQDGRVPKISANALTIPYGGNEQPGDSFNVVVDQIGAYHCDGNGAGTNGCTDAHQNTTSHAVLRRLEDGVRMVWREGHPLVYQDTIADGSERVFDHGAVTLKIEVIELADKGQNGLSLSEAQEMVAERQAAFVTRESKNARIFSENLETTFGNNVQDLMNLGNAGDLEGIVNATRQRRTQIEVPLQQIETPAQNENPTDDNFPQATQLAGQINRAQNAGLQQVSQISDQGAQRERDIAQSRLRVLAAENEWSITETLERAHAAMRYFDNLPRGAQIYYKNANERGIRRWVEIPGGRPSDERAIAILNRVYQIINQGGTWFYKDGRRDREILFPS